MIPLHEYATTIRVRLFRDGPSSGWHRGTAGGGPPAITAVKSCRAEARPPATVTVRDPQIHTAPVAPLQNRFYTRACGGFANFVTSEKTWVAQPVDSEANQVLYGRSFLGTERD